MAEKLDLESAKELVQMCCKGKLYDIERWIAEGKSLDVSAKCKRQKQETLLEMTVDTYRFASRLTRFDGLAVSRQLACPRKQEDSR